MKKAISIILAITMLLGISSMTATASADYVYPPSKVNLVTIYQISKSSVKLHWYSSVYYAENDCDGYDVYSHNSNGYKRIGTVKPNNKGDYYYTACNLKAKTKYSFAVRAFRYDGKKKVYSEYSDRAYAYTSPNEPTLTSAKYISKGKMEVKWKRVSNASGYSIEYCTNNKFENDGTTCYLTVSKDTKSKVITGLAKTKYYVRVRAYISYGGQYFCSDYGRTKEVNIKQGLSVKEMINNIGTNKKARSIIKKYTDNGVDINKYSSTYDKFKAIYDWHSKHNTDYGWSCMNCNSNFNSCISALFMNKKQYDNFIFLACDNFKNNDGSVVMHKWSVIHLAGVPYIFDPRLQGYSSNKTGTTYFGVSPSSTLGKQYLLDGYMFYYPTAHKYDKQYKEYYAYSNFPFVKSITKPSKVKATPTAKQKAIYLKWKEVNYANGYQIQYSKNKNMSSSTTIETKKLSTTIKNLSSKKTYYVRIRAYKVIGKTRIYGYWTDKMVIKTK